jgi:type II secretory pathway pseudopilin PulG
MRRRGYTFIELIVTMASSAILMAGLASVLFIASKAITPDATATQDANRSSLALAQMMSDVRLAMDFSERTARAVTFTVPDRNADGDVETVRYSWSGTSGDPLLYQYNSGSAVTLLADVKAFNLTALTRTIAADSLGAPPTAVAYQSFAESKAAAMWLH